MERLEEKAAWQFHGFKNGKRQVTIINTQHLQQVSGESCGSKRREGKRQQLGVEPRSAVAAVAALQQRRGDNGVNAHHCHVVPVLHLTTAVSKQCSFCFGCIGKRGLVGRHRGFLCCAALENDLADQFTQESTCQSTKISFFNQAHACSPYRYHGGGAGGGVGGIGGAIAGHRLLINVIFLTAAWFDPVRRM